MITDLIPVHRAFMARFEHHQVRGVDVPIKFFNAQPKLKEQPSYPSIIVSIFVPKFGGYSWVAKTKIRDGQAGTVQSFEPPKQVMLKYQVDARADRFDDSNDLFSWLCSAVEEKDGLKFLTVGDDTVEVEITDTRDVPDLDMGVFQWSITFDLRLPLFAQQSRVENMISTFIMNVEPQKS